MPTVICYHSPVLMDFFPNACIVQHYGLTEASKTTLLEMDKPQLLGSVGSATGDVQMKIGTNGRINISYIIGVKHSEVA